MSHTLNQRLEDIFGVSVVHTHQVSGGCIALSSIQELRDGRRLFVKTSPAQQAPFVQEANGLKELAKAHALRIPEVLHVEPSMLVLEAIEEAPRKKDFMAQLGRGLAQIHKSTQETFGFREDNFIGATPQPNASSDRIVDWVEFYWTHRLEFQWQLAEKKGLGTRELSSLMGQLEHRLPGLLAGSEERPALIHGDLWSGNVIADETGAPCLIDPAVYYGHREAELGMTRLFGGFGADFYRSYEEIFPLKRGSQRRAPLYKLYHVLNHLNLFGRSYYGQAIDLLQEVLR